MAPHEPLDDTETMQMKRMRGKCKHRLVAWWPCLGDTALLSLCCTWIYIVKISLSTYSLDYVLRSGGLKVRLAQGNCVGEFEGKEEWQSLW